MPKKIVDDVDDIILMTNNQEEVKENKKDKTKVTK